MYVRQKNIRYIIVNFFKQAQDCIFFSANPPDIVNGDFKLYFPQPDKNYRERISTFIFDFFLKKIGTTRRNCHIINFEVKRARHFFCRSPPRGYVNSNLICQTPDT